MKSGPRVLILAAVLAVCMGLGGLSAYGKDEGADKKELQRIKREMREKKQELKRAGRKERSILAQLDTIDREIQAGTAELAEQQKRLRSAEDALRETELNNTALSVKLAGLKTVYGQRLRALYKMRREGGVPAFSSDSLSGALKRIKYVSVIALRDRTVMSDYGSALDRLASRQTELSEKKQEHLSRKRMVELKRAELEQRKTKKAELLAGVRKEKGLYEQSLRELEESSAGLWAMIKRSEQEKKKTVHAVAPAAPGRVNPARSGTTLAWPAEGRVVTRFGMQRHPQFGTMVFRRGIEIETRNGDAVRAAREGQVAYADWHKGYGKLIILDHGNGLYTLYGNLSRLDLNKGDAVARGQLIGLSGDTGSQGSKLYFEVRRNGEAKDPLALFSKK